MNVKERGLILLTLFSISVLSGIFLLNSGISNNNNNIVSTTPDTINFNNPSGSVISSTLSPFFNHTAQDMQLYAKLADNSNSSFSNMFYDSFNNSNGTFTVVNNSHYAQDLFYYGMGMGQYIYPKVLLPGLYSAFETALLNSSVVGQKGAFMENISANYSVRSNEATVFNNLLPIMFLFTGLGDTQTYGLDTSISSQWNSVVQLFWDSTYNEFLHSNLDSNFNSNYLYASDNLLGAIVAFTIARESQLSSTLQSNATGIGSEIMASINSSTTSSLYDSAYTSFFNSISLGGTVPNYDKTLLTNALGISALLDWNIATNFDQNSSKVIQAEKIWNFMRYYSKFYNTTDNMYVESVSRIGNNVTNYNMDLLDNAWMLKATLDLFKTTGNITYYDAALQQYYGIENHLYDKVHGGYFSSLDSLNNQTNQIKTLSSYSMLVAALYEFYNIYNSTSLTANSSQSQYMYSIDDNFVVSANMNITMAFNYTSTVNAYWKINTPIQNAPVEFTLRYPNNNTIIENKNNNETTTTVYTDINGTSNCSFYIPKDLPFNNYSMSIFCNKTGFGYAYNKTILPYVSGITIANQTDIQQVFQNLYQGENGLINITFTSNRPDNISVQLQNTGQYFNYESLSSVKIINNTETSVVMNVSAKAYSPLGWQNVTLSMYNKTVLLYSQNISLYVSPAVEFKYSFFRNYDVDFSPFNITITLENHRTSAYEAVNLTINGTNFEPVSANITSIAPQQSKTVNIQITPTIFALYGESDFNLTLIRNNTIIYTYVYTVDLVPAIQINKISTVDVITQGNTPYMSLSITNYDLNSHEIKIVSNGEVTYETTIKNGQNYITAPISNSRFGNPYDVTTKTFNIQIEDENGKVLGTQTIILDVQLSPLNAIIFYVFPIVAAVALILYFKNKQIENEKRNK